ncbi:DUF4349 domain-containing protein [Methanolobus sediminis]|uniref:DUF4349 domain-containing protein n=1 Tax=Methanolobus sediminis TaxID=3072978 RepID=A0AA51YI75_9EURY|nr:DUF4349 domain-containing protein [Methanolobus sediminis]WMW24220.1 DUF4349 domain-containing protein [Methanolobus sediminis]
MKAKFVSIAVLIILLAATFISGCVSSYKESSIQSADYMTVEEYDDSYARNAVLDESGYADYGGTSTASVDRKTIATVDMTIQVSDAAKGVDDISEMVEASGGYVSSSSIYDSYYDSNEGKEGYITVRIPESESSSFLENVGELGEVTSKSVSAQDVTEEYIDVSARLDNLQRQETRLQEILNMTETVEDVLAVEKELERVRGDIESLTGRLNYLDDRVEFSTINIRVTEPRPITHSWGIRDAISESVNGFISIVNALIILVGYLLPLVIVLIFFGGAGVLIRRRMRR